VNEIARFNSLYLINLIQIYTAAEIVIHPDVRTEVEMDSMLIFTCLAIGRPLPFINWTNNGTTPVNNSTVLIYRQLMTEGGITFVRSILQTCATNSNSYRCIANNTVGVGVFNFGFDLNLEGKCQLLNWFIDHMQSTYTVLSQKLFWPMLSSILSKIPVLILVLL